MIRQSWAVLSELHSVRRMEDFITVILARPCPRTRSVISQEGPGVMHHVQGEWSVLARDGAHEVSTTCRLSVTIPKSYKKPKFLESLRAVLTEEGAVNLECKVIGVPQPTLSWFKDGVELKQGWEVNDDSV